MHGEGLSQKENVDRRHWKAGEDERNSRTVVRIPTVDDDEDGDALLAVEGGIEDAVNAPSNTPLRIKPTSALHDHAPRLHVPHVYRVGEHDSVVCELPQCPHRRASLPHPLPAPSAPSLSYGLATTTRMSPTLFYTPGNTIVRSFFTSDLAITVKAAPTPPWPSFPSQRRPDRHDYPATVRLDIQDVNTELK